MASVWKSRVAVCSLAAVVGSFGGFGSASAADLGGNCCADLEERIAELEATSARKGNRKVSLTVSGWVNEAIYFWDDGIESNVYVGTNSLEQSRVKFSGKAKINGDWSAGYTLELGVVGANSGQFSQDNDNGTTVNAVSVRKSVWFVENKSFGKVSVGQEGTSTYHLLDDADGVNTRNYSDAEAASVAMAQFFVNVNGVRQGSVQQMGPAAWRLQQQHAWPGWPPQYHSLRLARARRFLGQRVVGRRRHVGYVADLQGRTRRLQIARQGRLR